MYTRTPALLNNHVYFKLKIYLHTSKCQINECDRRRTLKDVARNNLLVYICICERMRVYLCLCATS